MRTHRAVLVMSLVLLASCAFAQTTAAPQGYPRDWSHSHLIFTNGGDVAARAAASQDPRMLQNWLHRNATLLRSRQTGAGSDNRLTFDWEERKRSKDSEIDWAISLGPTAGMKQGASPAKFTFDASAPINAASCANDFVVLPIGATPGAGTQANLVALNNLYTGAMSSYCPNGAQTPPTTDLTSATFLWSYAVGNGPIDLSPVLSFDGKKIAVVVSSNPATLHIVSWVAGQGTNATTGAVAPGSGGSSDISLSYTSLTVAGCTANASTNTSSAPFVDYDNDVIYVGAANGVLYRIKSVFHGTPTLDYCITVSAGNKLGSPVLDVASNTVFVSDGKTVYRYNVGASSFTLASSITIGFSNTSITDAPLVDSTNQFVYVFSSRNTANTGAIVSQMPINLSSHRDARIGPATAGIILDGMVDNNYFAGGPSTGTLYACGTQTTSSTRPGLYSIKFAANGQMNTAATMSNNQHINATTGTGPAGVCSPITEYFDGTNDRLFVGTGNATATTGANLVTEWLINTPITSTTTVPDHSATNEIGGVSAVTIDNNSTQPQASSIYFGTLFRGTASPCGSNLFCAVKLTQGALQ